MPGYNYGDYWSGGYQESANLAVAQQNTSAGKGDMSSQSYLHLAVAVVIIAAVLLVFGRVILNNARIA